MAAADPYNAPMRVNDALAMFLPRVTESTREYTRAVLEANEKRVREWYSDVLVPMSDDGVIPAMSVAQTNTLFVRACELQHFALLRKADLITDAPNVGEWREFFEKATVNDLNQAGTTAVSFGWHVIKHHFMILTADAHHCDFFAKFESPDDPKRHLARQRAAVTSRGLFEGDRFDFWDHDKYTAIRKRVAAALLYNIDFEKLPVKGSIEPAEILKALVVPPARTRSMSPLEVVCARRNNSLVVDFVKYLETDVIPAFEKVASAQAPLAANASAAADVSAGASAGDEGKTATASLSSKQVHALWMNFCDGREALRYSAFLSNTKNPKVKISATQARRWLEIIEGDVGELALLGPATVEYGHSLVRNLIQHHLACAHAPHFEQPTAKWADIPVNFHDLTKHMPAELDLGEISEDRVRDIIDRTTAVTANPIRPQT